MVMGAVLGGQYNFEDDKLMQKKKSPGRPKKVELTPGKEKEMTRAPSAGLHKEPETLTLRDRFALAALAGGIKTANCWNEADFMLRTRGDKTKGST